MKSIRFLSVFLVFAALAGLTLGCGGGPSDEELALAELQVQLDTVKQTYQELQSLRGEIASAEATSAEIEAVVEKKRTDEQNAQLEELAAKIPGLVTQSETTYDNLQAQLVDFLNVGLNDHPQSAVTAEALVIYSDQAIIVSDDIVAKSGDYKKAIDRLGGAKGYYTAINAPVYPPIEEKIAELQDWRFITQERFDALSKGMTMDEVKATVGVPYHSNIQDDEKRGVQTWLYKKREGGAAAVYFKIKTGKMYSAKWDVIKTKVVTD
ncbi:MAG: hypothetical protein DRJ65_03155 [Acidobacteria bacterium]|nr:MAG: hypothetical protein DRJ65_03155 [Acidobacteriota bacterium]